MSADAGKIQGGIVEVQTTHHRGFSPEEVAERCLNRVISVSDTAPPVIRDQAQAFRNNLRSILIFYMKEAVQSDRTTVCNALLDAGQKDLAETIRRL
jgi:hypothetical protein